MSLYDADCLAGRSTGAAPSQKSLHDVIVNMHECCFGADDTRSGTGRAVCFPQYNAEGQLRHVSLKILTQS